VGTKNVEARALVRAPIARVFERITDHEAMREWPGIGACRLVKDGSPRNGLGAVRRIRAMGITLDEEVVHYEPNVGYDYSIIRGLPVDHRGVVRLSEVDGGVEILWRVRLASRWPLVAEIAGTALQRGLPKALAYFAGETERA
jgi:uncharacterized protein YndB with AHSA1/START domain